MKTDRRRGGLAVELSVRYKTEKKTQEGRAFGDSGHGERRLGDGGREDSLDADNDSPDGGELGRQRKNKNLKKSS